MLILQNHTTSNLHWGSSTSNESLSLRCSQLQLKQGETFVFSCQPSQVRRRYSVSGCHANVISGLTTKHLRPALLSLSSLHFVMPRYESSSLLYSAESPREANKAPNDEVSQPEDLNKEERLNHNREISETGRKNYLIDGLLTLDYGRERALRCYILLR